MKILFLAPQPFFQERGTPIAVDLLLQALSARGESVDVLTYHEGSNIVYPGVRIHRIPRIPFIRNIPPGFSFKKLVCDCVFFCWAIAMALRQRYDVVHAVEESVFVALIIRFLRGTPYIYDMDSSLTGQMTDKYPLLRLFAPLFRFLESMAVRQAEVVVAVCNALAEVAQGYHPKRVAVLYDISLLDANSKSAKTDFSLRRDLGLSGLIVMYVGNLERYQGIDLLLSSFAFAHKRVSDAHLVVIGGAEQHIQHYRRKAENLQTNGSVHFMGPRPVTELTSLLKQADVLVSPRIQGGNTPMKLYSYLDSGRAVLATDLPTHTQVVGRDAAVLAKPEPEAMGKALVGLLEDGSLRERLALNARELIAHRHSRSAFLRTVNSIYEGLRQAAR